MATSPEVAKQVLKIAGTLVWDVDHGTTRRWGGMYAGKIPRVANPYVDGDSRL